MKNILISGSINSGKSTVAKILGKESKMAVIELDTLSTFIEDFLSFEEYLKLNWEIIPEIVKFYNSKNILVICVYPILEKTFNQHKIFLENFQIFTLDPGLEVALSDRGERKLNQGERERIKYHYENNIHNNSFASTINSANITPEDTVGKIRECLV